MYRQGIKKNLPNDVDAKACKCALRKTYRLPCAHDLAEFANSMPILLECVDFLPVMSPLVSIDHEVVVDIGQLYMKNGS